MLRSQDIVVLLKLLGNEKRRTLRDIAGELGFDLAGTQRSVRRLREAGLYSWEKERVYSAAAEELLLHGVKYFFPARWGTEDRGIPTSWAVEPISSRLDAGPQVPPVWPDPKGEVRGIALEPIHRIAPAAAARDAGLYRRLALLDALRSGEGPRIVEIAGRLLREEMAP
jgi:hypothetical protein